jgi:hypothetical protein
MLPLLPHVLLHPLLPLSLGTAFLYIFFFMSSFSFFLLSFLARFAALMAASSSSGAATSQKMRPGCRS